MMKKTTYKILIFVFLVGIGNACKKDYLTLENPNALNKDGFWESLEDADKGLTATYSALMDHNILKLDYEAIRSDEGFPGLQRPDGFGEKIPWFTQTYSATDAVIGSRWNAMYEVIFRANQVIEGLEKMDADISDVDRIYWDHMMGQALFLRGLMHFYLHSSYNKGEIIIRDYVPETLDDFNAPVSSSEEVIRFFRNDLYKAYSLLPVEYLYNDESSVHPVNKGRATKGAAATILGTSFLYEATEGSAANDLVLIDSAVKYFEDVKNNMTYRLATGDEIYELFTIAGEFGPESIFEICYNLEYNSELSTWSETSMHNRWEKEMFSNRGPQITAWMAWAYQSDPMDTNDARNIVADTLRTISLRTAQYAALAEDVYTSYQGGEEPIALALASGYGNGFGRISKYGSVHELAPLANEWQSNKNVVVNRLSGVYLMLAECYIYQGKVTESLELINAIRERWGLVQLGPSTDASRMFNGYDYASDPDALLEHLMYTESPLEMVHEGFNRRWIDLRRWGVISKRFNDLAAQDYLAQLFEWHGGVRSCAQIIPLSMADQARIDEAIANGAGADNTIIDYEYDAAAVNYNPELHDWYPMPMQEQSSNSAIE